MCKELNCAYLTLMENKWTPGLGKLQETGIQQSFICHTVSRDPATLRESAVLSLFTLTTSNEEGCENVLAISRPQRGLKHLKTCMCEHHRRRSPRESRRVTAAAAASHHIQPPTAHISVFTSEPWCQWKNATDARWARWPATGCFDSRCVASQRLAATVRLCACEASRARCTLTLEVSFRW